MPSNKATLKSKSGSLKSNRIGNPVKKAAQAGKKDYQSEGHSYDSARPKNKQQSRYSK